MRRISYSFIDIFSSESGINTISIPIIQRDYAQGRDNPEVLRVRTAFLQALKEAIVGEPLVLDFIYGDINKNGVMTPLDGQQRLTMLFLLHWYAAKSEQIPPEQYAFLKKFSYEIRYSSREFCRRLVEFNPQFTNKISEEIVDQGWFPLSWKKDPTIRSMLVVLDAIQKTFKGVKGIWQRLAGGAITFHFLALKEYGLSDDLYIKMNARGLPLTRFELFKAELEKQLTKVDSKRAAEVIGLINTDWSEMLWRYTERKEIIDEPFLHYFRFICDCIYYQHCQKNGNPFAQSDDEFVLIQRYFSVHEQRAQDNITLLCSYFDCWLAVENTLDEQYHRAREAGGQSVEIKSIFLECLRGSIDLGKSILLFSAVAYLIEQKSVLGTKLDHRLRIINNLVQHSKLHERHGHVLFAQAKHIMLTGTIDDRIFSQADDQASSGFCIHQVQEEKEKIAWLREHPDKQSVLFGLEDHKLLQGSIGVLGLENVGLFERFHALFACEYDAIDRALMTINNYAQPDGNNWRYQLGSNTPDSWRNLLQRSRGGKLGLKETLIALLEKLTLPFGMAELQQIAQEYLAACEESSRYEFPYYYIAYSKASTHPHSKYRNPFRPAAYGKYYWEDLAKNPYDVVVMLTNAHVSTSSYSPFIRSAFSKDYGHSNYGRNLEVGTLRVRYINDQAGKDTIHIHDRKEGKQVGFSIPIKQVAGIDAEDRIQKLQELVPLIEWAASGGDTTERRNKLEELQRLVVLRETDRALFTEELEKYKV